MLRYVALFCLTAQVGGAAPTCVLPACFTFAAAARNPTRWTFSQPADIAIRIVGPAGEVVVDAFEFGPETVTLTEPGLYRFEVTGGNRAPIPLPVSAETGRIWQAAERLSSSARRTKVAADADRALTAWQRIGHRASVARATLLSADIAFRASALSPARTAYETALLICRQDSDMRCFAEAANNSGLVSIQLGDFANTRQRLTEARNAWRTLGLKAPEAISLSNLGLLYRRTGDLQAAINAYDRARALLINRDPLGYARVLNNLALCYLSAGDYAKSHFYLRAALPIFVEHGSKRDAIRTRSNIARTLLLEKNYAPAMALLQQARIQAETEKDGIVLADIMINLGQAMLGQNLPAEAAVHLEAGRAGSEAIGDSRNLASALHLLGLAAKARGDVPAARRHLTQAADLRGQHGLRDDASSSMFELANLEWNARRLPEASRLAGQALDLVETRRRLVPGSALRASYLATKRRLVDLLVDIALDGGVNPAAALLAADRGRGRALLDLLAENQAAGAVPNELQHRRKDLDEKIDLLAPLLTSDNSKLREQMQGLIAEREEVQSRLREAQADSPFSQTVTSVETLQARGIPADSALLYFHLGETASYLWLVRPDRLSFYRLPSRVALEREVYSVVSRFGRLLDRRRSPKLQQEFVTAVASLSQSLLGNLREPLPPHLIVAPDADLHAVPFALLLKPDGQRLGLAHDLINTPSASFLLAGKVPRAPEEFRKSILMLADPVYSSSDPRLAGVPIPAAPHRPWLARLPFAAEIDAVRQTVPPARRQELLGFDASLSRLGQLPLQDFGVIQLSAHALADERHPELSWVAVSSFNRAGRPVPPFLYPRHFGEMRLNGSTVILSACETALGKQLIGEGFLGWTGSLFQGGASQLVLTLAKVEAEASSAFLREAYGGLFSPKPMSTEQALTLARRKLAASRRWSDPFHWASFVAIGRPSKARISGRL